MVEALHFGLTYFFIAYQLAVLVGTVIIVCWLLWQERIRAAQPKDGCRPTKTEADEPPHHRQRQRDAQPPQSNANKPTGHAGTEGATATSRRRRDQTTNGDRNPRQEKPDVETK